MTSNIMGETLTADSIRKLLSTTYKIVRAIDKSLAVDRLTVQDDKVSIDIIVHRATLSHVRDLVMVNEFITLPCTVDDLTDTLTPIINDLLKDMSDQ